ncbi:hypothetical protein Syun_023477 [Stephania yunnanensis]|uniref:Uncharacterized protein n=1 Tax=Stephania yunnanensis TaxID=152371 RepID=A0AAP0F923_9MAGN
MRKTIVEDVEADHMIQSFTFFSFSIRFVRGYWRPKESLWDHFNSVHNNIFHHREHRINVFLHLASNFAIEFSRNSSLLAMNNGFVDAKKSSDNWMLKIRKRKNQRRGLGTTNSRKAREVVGAGYYKRDSKTGDDCPPCPF